MKITFVCQYLAKGGAERVMSVLIDYFVQKGYSVRLILLYENIISYPLPQSVEIVVLNWNRKMNIFNRVIKLNELRALLKNQIIITFLYSAIRDTVASTMFTKKHLIVSERNDPNNDPKGRIRRWIRTFSYFFADEVVFQTEDAKKYFPKYIRQKGIVIANPLKENLIEPFNGCRERRIVSVCRLSEQKNLTMAIDAFEKFNKVHPEYIYEIYGEGELRESIQQYIEKKNLREKVFLKGFYQNIHSEIVNAAVFVLPSNYEGISNSMLEALAIGLPVICTDCPIGGARQVIENGKNGVLIPVGDTAALFNAMCKIVEDEDFAGLLSSNATNVRNDYNADLICKKWETLLC